MVDYSISSDVEDDYVESPPRIGSPYEDPLSYERDYNTIDDVGVNDVCGNRVTQEIDDEFNHDIEDVTEVSPPKSHDLTSSSTKKKGKHRNLLLQNVDYSHLKKYPKSICIRILLLLEIKLTKIKN